MKKLELNLWGPTPLQRMIKKIVRHINEITPTPDNRTVFGDEHPDGILLSADPSKAAGTGQLQVKDASDATSKKIFLSFGEVGGNPPTNLPVEGLTITVGGSTNVWCELARDADTEEITTGAIATGSSFPEQTETLGIARIASPTFETDGFHAGQIARSTLYCGYCGGWNFWT